MTQKNRGCHDEINKPHSYCFSTEHKQNKSYLLPSLCPPLPKILSSLPQSPQESPFFSTILANLGSYLPSIPVDLYCLEYQAAACPTTFPDSK